MIHREATLVQLMKALDNIDLIQNEEWLQSFEERKLKELEFHDRDRTKIAKLGSDTYDRFYGNKKYYTATRTSRQYTLSWIERYARGKDFFDYACGNGFNAILAAKPGASISLGFDISPVSVQNAKSDAESAGVHDKCRFFQADAENTKLPDDSVPVYQF